MTKLPLNVKINNKSFYPKLTKYTLGKNNKPSKKERKKKVLINQLIFIS